jgi:16S rRNA (guanine527-N7)-methyltransferase
MTLGPALAGGIRSLGLDIDAVAQGKLLAYVALLEKWNRTYNLTAIREPERIVTHHLLDSLAVLPYLTQATLRLADIGSGGGLPGIPLAVARPAWHATLIDSSRKKASFLRQASLELGLTRVEVVPLRVESYEPSVPFDVAISRAYSNLGAFIEAARRIAPSGRWLAMKGAYPHDELAAVPPAARVLSVARLDIPGLQAERHLVIMEAASA